MEKKSGQELDEDGVVPILQLLLQKNGELAIAVAADVLEELSRNMALSVIGSLDEAKGAFMNSWGKIQQQKAAREKMGKMAEAGRIIDPTK